MLFVLALFAACSDGSVDDAAPEQRSGTDVAGAEPSAEPSTAAASKDRTQNENDDERAGRGGPDGEDPSKTAGGDGGSTDGAWEQPSGSVFNDGETEDDHSSALHPAAGRYLYSQTGFERFCQAATCDERPLPPRQAVEVSLRGRSDTSAVVVSEARSSDSRTVRTTTAYTRNEAAITHVYALFSYEGFTFENSYEPRPPVESLRFPLKQGKSWSGSWRDSTSGDYSINVLGRDTVQVNGAAVTAFKLSMVTDFRGEFSGTSKAILWVDVAKKAMVKTTGKIDLRSSYGRYVTEFNNKLRSGPGYR